MRFKLCYLFLMFAMMNCTTSGTGGSVSKTSKDDAANFVSNFYNWYLNKIYKSYKSTYFLPGYTKLSNTSYIFDIAPTMKKIRSSGYFSEEFIRTDSLKIASCNTEMLKEKWDYEPEPEFNIKPCNFLWKDRFIGGQGENLDSFKIVESTIKRDNVFIISVDIYEKEHREYNAKVEVQHLDNDVFKINAIYIEWVRYK